MTVAMDAVNRCGLNNKAVMNSCQMNCSFHSKDSDHKKTKMESFSYKVHFPCG